MSETTFLELVEGVGVEADFIVDPKTGLEIPNPKAGDPAPLTSVGVKIPFPVMVGNDVVEEQRTAEIVQLPEIDADWKARPVKDDTQVLACARIIPGTRIVETNAPPIVSALLGSHWQVCDPPKTDTKAPARASSKRTRRRSSPRSSRQAAGKADDKVEA